MRRPYIFMEAFIGLGSNIGDRRDYLQQALDLMRQLPVTSVRQVSSLYRNPAVTLDGTVGPEFLNAVCSVETALMPRELLGQLKLIEARLGRLRHGRWEPRTIDLDLLSYGRRREEGAQLQLPHPDLAERLFVLYPLREVAPRWRHPVSGLSVQALVERLADSAQAGIVPTCCGSLS